jgi:hypothetical protein
MFKLTGAQGDVTYFFSAEDEEQLEKWMSDILSAIEQEALAPHYRFFESNRVLMFLGMKPKGLCTRKASNAKLNLTGSLNQTLP